jgi:hypothetical protein
LTSATSVSCGVASFSHTDTQMYMLHARTHTCMYACVYKCATLYACMYDDVCMYWQRMQCNPSMVSRVKRKNSKQHPRRARATQTFEPFSHPRWCGFLLLFRLSSPHPPFIAWQSYRDGGSSILEILATSVAALRIDSSLSLPLQASCSSCDWQFATAEVITKRLSGPAVKIPPPVLQGDGHINKEYFGVLAAEKGPYITNVPPHFPEDHASKRLLCVCETERLTLTSMLMLIIDAKLGWPT